MVKLMCGLRTVLWMALVIGLSWFPVAWADLNDGLVAHYPFEGNANDASGNGNDGVVNGATLTEDRFGNADSAYVFDGNDLIEIQESNSLDITGNITIALWVQPYEEQPSMYPTLLSKHRGITPGAQYQVGLKTIGNHSKIRFCVEPNFGCKIGNTSFAHAKYTFIAVTYDGNYIRYYLNGNLDNEFESNEKFTHYTSNIPIGGTPYYMWYFRGIIDDVRIYNRALSEDEVQALYQQGDANCKHATYSLKNRTLIVPFVEMPVVDFLSGQPTGEIELWTGSLKQIYGTTNRFRLLSKTVAQITDGSSSSCPATYAFETATLSIPYIDIPTGITVGNKNFENEVDVFKATMTWEPMGRSFVVQEVEQLP